MAKGWSLNNGNLLRGGLPRNSVDRITDHPDMTSAVDRRRKALTKKFYCGSLLPFFGVRVSVTFHLTCVHMILVRFGC